MTNAERFLNAFSDIEKHLRSVTRIGRAVRFTEVLRTQSVRDPVVRRFEYDLREYADLRNAIVHNGAGNERVIADPRRPTVLHLEHIRDRILQPPRLGEHFRRDVQVSQPTESVGGAARRMFEGNFSQLPIYMNDKFVALLTTETVARWLGAKFAENGGLLDEPIERALRHVEGTSRCEFLGLSSTVAEALERFHARSTEGRSLDAIIMTQDGKEDQPPLGILTTFDLPKLLKLISPEPAAVDP
jgi:CBS domain-containing protein